MAELPTYQFPARTQPGVLFGLSAARLAVLGVAGIVFIVAMSDPTAASVAVGAVVIGLLLAAATLPVAGRPVVDWLPVAVTYGWRQATRNNEFYTSPDVSLDLPPEVLDLPGELFGIELHQLDDPSGATTDGVGVMVDTFRHRQVAVAEIAAADFLFLDPDDQQVRIAAWGRVLDHVAQSMPEITRLQLLHITGAAGSGPLTLHHRQHGGRGTDASADSYTDVIHRAGAGSQEHRLVLAIALDLHVARREIRQAGGRTDGAARVLMDRAAALEEGLRGAGVDVHGWLSAPAIARVLRIGYDPAARRGLDDTLDDGDGAVTPAAAGPTGMADGWSAVRHDSG